MQKVAVVSVCCVVLQRFGLDLQVCHADGVVNVSCLK